MKKTSLLLIVFIPLFSAYVFAQNADLPAWKAGYLDIHHINTGRGNSSFIIMPDGTTLLIDAGDLNKKTFDQKFYPLKAASSLPDKNSSAGQTIANYIKAALPEKKNLDIDYALITHFHTDHYGQITDATPFSADKSYRLTGISEVGSIIPIKTMLDRGYPAYDFPLSLKKVYQKEPEFLNYVSFLNYSIKKNHTLVQKLAAGSNDQLVLKKHPKDYPLFGIRNVKANNLVWDGKTNHAKAIFLAADVIDEKGVFNENPLSLALKISYGKFDYYTGGDNTGLQGFDLPKWFDVETPIARSVGAVDAMSLDHHGNRDASNAYFLEKLQPKVAVQQAWCSDQPGQEVAHRLITPQKGRPKTAVFSLFMHPETETYLGPWIKKGFESTNGHVLIRVMPGGKTFYVFVLDDTQSGLHVKDKFGPYTAG